MPTGAVLLLVLLGSMIAGYLFFGLFVHQPAVARASTESWLSIPAEQLDFGTVWEQGAFHWQVALTNTSKQSLLVDRFETSCDCTSITPASIHLAPGEVKELTLVLNLNLVRSLNQETQPFSVGVAAVAEDKVIGGPWTIQGDVRPFFSVAPTIVHLGEQEVSQEPKRREMVIVQCNEPVQSIAAESSTPLVEARIIEISSDHRSAELQIELADDMMVPPLGKNLAETVSIRAISYSGDEISTTAVDVTGFLQGVLMVMPRSISFGMVELGGSAKRTERLTIESPTGASMLVEDLRVRGHGIEVDRLGAGPASLLEYEVSLAGVAAGNFAGEIALDLRLDGYASPVSLTVPVLGYVVDSQEFVARGQERSEKSVLVGRD